LQAGDPAFRAFIQRRDFSGGQIENIARRVQIVWVLEGRNPDFDEILKMCGEERLYKTKETRKIGYLQ